jgi:hypothetical protein
MVHQGEEAGEIDGGIIWPPGWEQSKSSHLDAHGYAPIENCIPFLWQNITLYANRCSEGDYPLVLESSGASDMH